MIEGTLDASGPLRPPSALKPSQYSKLLECRLQYVWGAGEPPHLPLPPQARVGTLIHRLFARAATDLPADVGAVRAAWDEEAERVERDMAGSWLERHFLPLRRRMRDFEDRRQSALRRALAIAANPHRGRGHGGLPPEAGLASQDGRVRGNLDLVVTTPEGVVIRDHKTGQVYETDPQTRERTPARAYSLQLQLYAALYHQRTGRWPDRLEIVSLQGETVEVPFTPGECSKLLQDASRQVEELAGQVQDITAGRVPLTVLASPGEHCSNCSYRPICAAYRASCESPQGEPGARRNDVWGRVVAVRVGRPPLVALELQSGAQTTHVLDLDGRPTRNPALAGLRPGDTLAIFNLGHPRAAGAYAAGDFTVVYRVKEAAV